MKIWWLAAGIVLFSQGCAFTLFRGGGEGEVRSYVCHGELVCDDKECVCYPEE